jgi:hypothetical protein
MQLRQSVPDLFCHWRIENPRQNNRESAIAIPLARCASVIPRRGTPDAIGCASSWHGGRFAPHCIPRTRAFSPWTRPKALRPLDFRPGGVSPSGHLTAVSAAAPTRRAFAPSMDLQTGGDFALHPDPHRPAVRRLDPRQGFRAPGPRQGLCAHRPQRGFRAPAPRPAVRPTGCARPEDAP